MASRFIGVLLCSVAWLTAAPAWAQSAATAPTSKMKARAFVHFESQVMTAKDTFDAVIGASALKGLGGGGELQNVWRRVFVRAAASRFSETGERVFVVDDLVFPLGIPLELSMTPIEVAAGWRFSPVTSRRIVPYIGGGAVFMKYSEKSDADAADEAVNETYPGVLIFGGVEVPLWKVVSAGAEVGWRSAKVTSPGGALGAFGENDLGGITMRVMVSLGKK